MYLRSLFTLIGLVLLPSTASPQDLAFLEKWADAVAGDAYARSMVRVESKATSTSSGELLEKMVFELVSRDDEYRTSMKIFEGNGALAVAVEQCATDQYVHIQTQRVAGKTTFEDFRVSGCVEDWDKRVNKSISFGVNNLLLGRIYHPPPNAPSIPQVLLQSENHRLARLEDGLVVTAQYDSEGLPVRITQVYSPWGRVDGRFDSTKRDKQLTITLGFTDIQWREKDGIPYMHCFNEVFAPRGEPEPKFRRVMEVVSFRPDVRVADNDLLPTFPIKDRTPVNIRDLGIKGEWRNGEIVQLDVLGEN